MSALADLLASGKLQPGPAVDFHVSNQSDINQQERHKLLCRLTQLKIGTRYCRHASHLTSGLPRNVTSSVPSCLDSQIRDNTFSGPYLFRLKGTNKEVAACHFAVSLTRTFLQAPTTTRLVWRGSQHVHPVTKIIAERRHGDDTLRSGERGGAASCEVAEREANESDQVYQNEEQEDGEDHGDVRY